MVVFFQGGLNCYERAHGAQEHGIYPLDFFR